MTVARFRRDAASLKKDVLYARIRELGALQELDSYLESRNISEERVRKEEYLTVLKRHFLAKDFPRGIPKPVRDSVLFPPELCSLWEAKDDSVWTSSNWVLEPLYTGFRATVSVSAAHVAAFSRFDSDDNFRRPEVALPTTAIQELRNLNAVFDVMLVADQDEVAAHLEKEGTSVSEEFAALDVVLGSGRKAIHILERCESFHVVLIDILEENGEQKARLPYEQRRVFLESYAGKVVQVAPSVTGSAEDKIRFYLECVQWTDGCAAKKKDSLYFPGGRGWTKLKGLNVMDNTCVLGVFARDGSAFVDHPSLGKVEVAQGVDFIGPGFLTFHGGRITSFGSKGAKRRDLWCLWLPEDMPIALPQTVGMIQELADSKPGLSLRDMLGDEL